MDHSNDELQRNQQHAETDKREKNMSDDKLKKQNLQMDNIDHELPEQEDVETIEDAARRKRRNVVKGVAAAGGLAAFAAGYSNTAKNMVTGLIKGTSAEPTENAIFGNALQVEGQIEDGKWVQNTQQAMSNTQCFGCWTVCGIRVRVDKAKNEVIRVAGNPYHPLSSEKQYRYNMPISEAWTKLGGDGGIYDRSTACARGAQMGESVASPYRVLSPLKRVGKRGEGQWKRISFEQLIDEVVNGGDLFGEGHVEGLKDIRDLETLIDPKNPEFGVKANQLLVSNAGNEGREPFVRRFTNNAFGSRNFTAHGAYCGLAYRLGSGAVMDDMDKNAHAKPDFENVEFAIFMGTSPAQSGNPFKRQGRLLAGARTKDAADFSYAVVAPNLPMTNTLATQNNTWISILPGTDSAMSMAMIRYIIDNKRYNNDYLTVPGKVGMAAAKAVSHSNATHLVIIEEESPLYGQFLRLADIEGGERSESPILTLDAATGELLDVNQSLRGTLYHEGRVTLADGSDVEVATSFTMLKRSADRFSLEEYSDVCGVPVATIEGLAYKFTNHGHKAAIITHGGMMSGNGFYNTWSLLALNVLIGNMNYTGGMHVNGGKYADFGPGPRYDFTKFDGMVQPKGIMIGRAKRPYESSTEYKERKARGENPYPASRPWYPFAGGQATEMLISALNADPYPLKAWISNMTNPVYGITGFRQLLLEKLADPKVLPLFIAIDAFINETTAMADYIVPDTHNFESWGFGGAWAGVPFKTSTARWPIVEPRVEKDATGQPISMESFFIAVSKKMGLPGFGENAIKDYEGKNYPVNTAEDFYLKAAANMAFDGSPVPESTREELELTGVKRIKGAIESVLKPEEQMRVAYVFARGGRFADYDTGWDGDQMVKKWTPTLQLWNEKVGVHRHFANGERYSGTPTYHPPRFADGSSVFERFPKEEWPLSLTSFKSNIVSSTSGSTLRLRMIKPTNFVAISDVDAKKFNIENGDMVRIESPNGAQEAQIMVLDGVKPGVLAIEHGYGRRDVGARSHVVDGKAMDFSTHVGSGLNLNDLAISDPSRPIPAPWLDWVTGAAVRQGIPARIVKI